MKVNSDPSGLADMDAKNIPVAPGCVCRREILLLRQIVGGSWHGNMDGKEILIYRHYWKEWNELMQGLLSQSSKLSPWLLRCVLVACSSSVTCARGSHGTAAPGPWPTAWRPPSPAWLSSTFPFLGPKHTAGLHQQLTSLSLTHAHMLCCIHVQYFTVLFLFF